VPLRIVDDKDELQAQINRSVEINDEMWTITAELARAVIALVVDLDRLGDGIIRTSQQPLIDLRDLLEGR
jgi:hypothetical protein